MSEAPRVGKSGDEPLRPPNNSELSEIAWQKWVNKNKERDAARRVKLIRMLWLILPLLLACVVVWWLDVSK
jgi:hypothetical protein